MLDPVKQSQTEQSIAEISEVLPRMWRALYLGLIEAGFKDHEAMTLLIAFITKPVENG